MIALDVVRLEAGLILLEVDYTSARHAMIPDQAYSPGEIGLGKLVDFEQGRLRRPAGPARGAPRRRAAPAAGGPRDRAGRTSTRCTTPRACRRPRRPSSIARPSRCSTPAAGRSAGSPATAGARSSRSRSPWPRCRRPSSGRAPSLQAEWTVEARRGRVGATVVELPFLDLPRKRLRLRLRGSGRGPCAGQVRDVRVRRRRVRWRPTPARRCAR